MINAVQQIEVKVCNDTCVVLVNYNPKTERTLYDICDLNGRVIKTGEIKRDETKIEVSDLYDDQYILLVLDGDRVCSKKFRIDRSAA